MNRRIHPATLRALMFVLLAIALLYTTVSLAVPKTSVELKQWFGQPWALLLLMYLGALGSAAKTVSTARRDGSKVTFWSYLAYRPETSSAAVAVFTAWLGLLFTDQLNFASAAAYGAIANTAADVIRSGGRTSSLSPEKKPDTTASEETKTVSEEKKS